MKNTTESLLTIIVPCYNAENYLKRCLTSLNNLDYEHISVLFVDDGSIDETRAILERWVANRHNASLITKTNGGYSSAINFGLDNCNSEYVMFMGVDDELIPQGIEVVIKQIRENKADILAFSTKKIFDDIEKNGNVEAVSDPITVYKNSGYFCGHIYDLQKRIGKDFDILFTRDTSRCYKVDVIGDTRYFGKTGVSADGCFASIVACKARSYEFVNEYVYCWHVHSDSVSRQKKSFEKMKEEADVWQMYFDWISNYNGSKIPDPIIYHYFVFRKLVNTLCEGTDKENFENKLNIANAFIKRVVKENRVSFKSKVKILFRVLHKV